MIDKCLTGQVVTESSPVYRTEPVVETSVIRLLFGAKETFTTLLLLLLDVVICALHRDPFLFAPHS